MHDINMIEHGWTETPSVHSAGLICEVSSALGLPLDPARLRSWHSREGMELGVEGNGWRRYNDIDVLAAVLIRSLAIHGIPSGELVTLLEAARGTIALALHRASVGISVTSSSAIFICAARQDEGQKLHLFGGEREEVVQRAVSLAAFAPVTLLNLSVLAGDVWRELGKRRKLGDK